MLKPQWWVNCKPLAEEALKVKEAGDAVVLEVRDEGPGLTPAEKARAFDRFWRGDSARSGTGAGLGLAIVAAIADEHGGSATAVNASGDGARFTLELPINAARED